MGYTRQAVKPFAWMSDPQYLAQVGHFLGGLSLVFVVGAFAGREGALWTLVGGTALAAIKEFVFDVASWGEGDSWADSAMDFVFYLAGGTAGGGLFLLALSEGLCFR